MAEKIRILILEDNPADAELMRHELERAGLVFDYKVVSNEASYLEALGSFCPDIVLSDYTLPQFNGMDALHILLEKLPDVPLVIVTGTISEEVAVECMVMGAADYVLKTHLPRLPQSVRRTLERAEMIRDNNRSAQLLKEERDRAQLYLDVAAVIMLALDREGRVTLLNRKGYALLGYDEGSLEGESWFDTCLPELVRREMKELYCDILDGKTGPFEYVENAIVTRSGEERLIAWHNTVLKDAEGEICGTLSSGEDITERRRAEDELKESERRFRLLYEKAPLGYQSLDADGRILDVNQAWLATLGYSREEVIGRSVADFLAPDQVELFEERFPKFKAAGEMHGSEFDMVRKDGSRLTASFDGSIAYDERGLPDRTHCIFANITERRRAELAMKEGAERMRTMIQNIPGVVYHCANDPEWTMFYLSDAIECISGYPASEFLENRVRSYASVIHPDDRGMVSDSVQQGISARKMYEIEYRIVCSDGSVKWVGERGQGVFDEAGNLRWLDGVIFDITDRKRAEDALRESEAKYSALIKYAGEAILLADDHGTILETNRRAEAILGRGAYELVGQNFLGYHAESELARADGFFRHAVSIGKPVTYETMLAIRGGGELAVEILLTPIVYMGKSVIKVNIRDISVRKRTEAIKNNLIRDVTHKLKTPIATAQMACDLAFDSMKKNDEDVHRRAHELITISIAKLRTDVDRAMDYFAATLKGAGEERRCSSLRKVAENVMREERAVVSERGMSFDVNIRDEADMLAVDEMDLYTVIGNLVSNATSHTKTGKIEVQAVPAGRNIRITVSDTGAGIPADAIGRLFEPFFQVTAASPGMGLGLPICKQVVERYNGKIEVRSEGLGKGTQVIVELPAAVGAEG